jgi:hypothetical protein
MNLEPFILNGQTYDLSHLRAFPHTFPFAATAKDPARSFDVVVDFSVHCFTRAQEPDDPPDLFYCFDRDGKARNFNLERWDLSRQLRNIIINHFPTLNPQFTNRDPYKHNNFIVVPVVTRGGVQVEYEVFFKVFKAGKRLFLEIESAYVRDPSWHNRRPTQGRRMAFAVILRKVQAGENLGKFK